MSKVKIQTAQNITIEQNLAGTFERISAYILDLVILYSFLFTLIYIYSKTVWKDMMSGWAFIMILTLPHFLYFPVIQYYNNGQSFGKKIMKLRVVKTDNTHPRLLDFVIRWLFRTIEISMIPGLALLLILMNKKKQRLGDIVAGTTVISEKNKVKLSYTIFEEIDEAYKAFFPETNLLKEEDIRLIKEVYTTTPQNKKGKVLSNLRKRLEEILHIKKPVDWSDSKFIETVIKDYNYYSLHKRN